MAITLSYDLKTDDGNHRNYIRSMLERFGWQRLGGSVFRYQCPGEEDWLNEVVPSLMFFRSYIVAKGIHLKFFTLDTSSITRIDFSGTPPLGKQPLHGNKLELYKPQNDQSGVKLIKRFVSSAADVLE